MNKRVLSFIEFTLETIWSCKKMCLDLGSICLLTDFIMLMCEMHSEASNDYSSGLEEVIFSDDRARIAKELDIKNCLI